jgi:hypothetical protein
VGNLKLVAYVSRKVLGDCGGRLCGIFWDAFKECGWTVRKYSKEKMDIASKKNSVKDGDDFYE